ncbi:MAG: hypothetical protein ACOC93_01220, partial [Planctomycetota bacterium]
MRTTSLTNNRPLLGAGRTLPALVVVLLATTSASACWIPVFRYGLERWPADPYELTIFHDGELTPGQREIVDGLTQAAPADGTGANLHVHTVDLGQDDPPLQELWARQDGASVPWMVLRYPQT